MSFKNDGMVTNDIQVHCCVIVMYIMEVDAVIEAH